MLLGAFLFAIAMVFLFSFLFSGPKLGVHYDFLQNYKSSNVSREILIIDTEDYIESGDIFTVLVALTEMDAANLILTGRVSPSSSPIILTDAEVRRRFMDEYSLLGSNIRNLFEGIRKGSVPPVQAPLFVEQVVELAEQGRDRLITTLIDRDEDLLRSVAVFGNYLQVDARGQADSDGKLRRVKPVDPDTLEEHPVYIYLKNRYAISQIESSSRGQILWLRSHDSKDIDIPLDKNGNILTTGNALFRHVNIDVFRRYTEADNAMYSALSQANELRAFSLTPPDRIPLFLYDYTQQLLEDLFVSPNGESRYAWIASRADYFESLDEYFSGAPEAALAGQIEEQIAGTDSSNEQMLESLITRKNDLLQIFSSMREIYAQLSSLHSALKNELAFSFCIMGPWPNAEYSAILANVLITGSHVDPVYDRDVIIWAILAVFIVLLIIFLLRPFILLPAGLILSVLSAVVFCFLFISFSYWIDPLIILFSSLAGTLIVFFTKCAYLYYRASSFRLAYRTAVSRDTLRGLIKSGSPRLTQVSASFAAVIAVKDIYLSGKEDKERPQETVRNKRTFFSMVKRNVFIAGASIAGYEGDTVLVCFGSPLDKSYNPVTKACNFVSELMKNEKISWHFGMDAGDCSFSWSPESGFTVSGRPAVRARLLVSRAAHFKTKALVTNSVLEKIHKNGKRVGSFNDESGAIFELPQ
jgi:hypothetical protein